MPNYIRPKITGGTWFFTVNLLNRNKSLLTDHIGELRLATLKTKRKFPFRIDAFVVLPDHIHAIWTLPDDDHDFSLRWRLIKNHFSKAMPKTEPRDKMRKAKGERGIWQRRFWEHAIRDEADYQCHLDYCYINPLKHRHVKRVQDWPFSSFHRDVRRKLYPMDWAGEFDETAHFGERSQD